MDFLGVGDITTDAFIELEKEYVALLNKNGESKLCIQWGDKIPFKSTTVVSGVGNAANASVSASRLGLSSAFSGTVGDDAHGRECVETLKKEKVETKYIQVDKSLPSNYHYVLSCNAERTILVKHNPYTYHLPEESPRYVYLSSIGEHAVSFHEDVVDFCNKTKAKLVFQPGTFQIKLGYEKLKRVYKSTELFFCNKEEAQRILNTKEETFQKLLFSMRDLGPKIVVITDGPRGAYSYDGKIMLYSPIYPDPKPPVERTGAGDAFSSAFTSLIALGKPIEEALLKAPINSMSVVQHIGAQKGLLTLDEMDLFFERAPIDYSVKEI